MGEGGVLRHDEVVARACEAASRPSSTREGVAGGRSEAKTASDEAGEA
ncbi:hypothetical protein DM2_453 [Halorubrum sp. DM2]|nr:hypothetical protein DM2_453 [Halorubrum sp. DM2]